MTRAIALFILAFIACVACGRGYFEWVQPSGRHPEVHLAWDGGNCRAGLLTEWRTATSHTGLVCYPEEFYVWSAGGWDNYLSDFSTCYLECPPCTITLTVRGILPTHDELTVSGVGVALGVGDHWHEALYSPGPNGRWTCTATAPKPADGEYVAVAVSMFVVSFGPPWAVGEVNEVRLETDLEAVQ